MFQDIQETRITKVFLSYVGNFSPIVVHLKHVRIAVRIHDRNGEGLALAARRQGLAQAARQAAADRRGGVDVLLPAAGPGGADVGADVRNQ